MIGNRKEKLTLKTESKKSGDDWLYCTVLYCTVLYLIVPYCKVRYGKVTYGTATSAF